MKHLKKILVILAFLLLIGCARDNEAESTTEKEEVSMSKDELRLRIDDRMIEVEWLENESVEALRGLAREGTIEIAMSMYGGFEQVGNIGTALPRNDEQTVTECGDIVLYSGNQIVIFYGSNSWSYTRLGRILNMSKDELETLFGDHDVRIELSLE
ncbi:MAG: hypothetical protein IJI44_04110 [Erysipelotrichaceae bacterium]|nr:hypothetical protein [Erysipelotrichaceae bacterium]